MCSISEYASVDDARNDSPGYKSGATEATVEKPRDRVGLFDTENAIQFASWSNKLDLCSSVLKASLMIWVF